MSKFNLEGIKATKCPKDKSGIDWDKYKANWGKFQDKCDELTKWWRRSAENYMKKNTRLKEEEEKK